MNKKLLFLTKNSIYKKMKSKWFLLVNILLCVLIVGLINIDYVISFFGGDFNEKVKIVVVDNTNEVYDIFNNSIKSSKAIFNDETDIEIKKVTSDIKNAKKNLKDKILIVLDKSDTEYLKAQIISEGKINTMDYQLITTSLSTTKYNYALMKSTIDQNELLKISKEIDIKRVILDEGKKDIDTQMETIMGTVFPTLILPFFMLAIFLVQMIGTEIYEEKSSRSMEIIISNVSPKVHFFSKIIASNFFAISQGLLLIIYAVIGFLIRVNDKSSVVVSSFTNEFINVWHTLVESGFAEKLIYIIPLTLLLLLLSFLAYSIVAGILASMTVNMEDYQQIQTPIMLISLLAYYLAIMAGMFEGSIFIKTLSYIPFISCLLSPALLIIGQINIIDVIISIILLIIFNVVVLKKGMRIYKTGILNYSNEKIWSKFKKIVKNK